MKYTFFIYKKLSTSASKNYVILVVTVLILLKTA